MMANTVFIDLYNNKLIADYFKTLSTDPKLREEKERKHSMQCIQVLRMDH